MATYKAPTSYAASDIDGFFKEFEAVFKDTQGYSPVTEKLEVKVIQKDR